MAVVNVLHGLTLAAVNRVVRLLEPARAALRRRLRSESRLVLATTLVAGAVCGLVAVSFHLAIRSAQARLLDRAMDAPGRWALLLTIVTPVLGALVAGLIVHQLVPGARGSGLPQVKEAFARPRGRIRMRDALGRFLASSLQLGSGASLGREEPTVHICAGTAGAVARAAGLSPLHQRRMLPVGFAAGIAAAFNAPVAAVTFTLEEVVGTLDPSMLSGAVVAAAVASIIERSVLGGHPLMPVVSGAGLTHLSSLLTCVVLGAAAAALAVLFHDTVLGLRARFKRPGAMAVWTRPMVGALVTGLLAAGVWVLFGARGVAGSGSEALATALGGDAGWRLLLALGLAKLVATVFSYASGGVGGLLGPVLCLGALLGAGAGHLDRLIPGHGDVALGSFALVGMGALFAGVIRAPITSVLLLLELTGSQELVLPLMVANTTAFAIARLWRPTSIYRALLTQDGVIAPDLVAPEHPLDAVTAGEAAVADRLLPVHASPRDAARQLEQSSGAGLLLVHGDGRPVGVITPEAAPALFAADPTLRPVSSFARAVPTIHADAPLAKALVRMEDTGSHHLAVVSAGLPERALGLLSMGDLVRRQGNNSMPPPVRRGATAPGSDAATRTHIDPVALADLPLHRSVEVASAASLLASTTDDAPVRVIARGTGADRRWSVVLPDELLRLGGFNDLATSLVASDVAVPAASLRAEGPSLTEARVVAAIGTHAALVLESDDGSPRQVLLRSELAAWLLDRRTSAESEPARAAVG